MFCLHACARACVCVDTHTHAVPSEAERGYQMPRNWSLDSSVWVLRLKSGSSMKLKTARSWEDRRGSKDQWRAERGLRRQDCAKGMWLCMAGERTATIHQTSDAEQVSRTRLTVFPWLQRKMFPGLRSTNEKAGIYISWLGREEGESDIQSYDMEEGSRVRPQAVLERTLGASTGTVLTSLSRSAGWKVRFSFSVFQYS